MNATDLKIVLEKHKAWLLSAGEDGTRANLRYANLEDANLEDANLEGANLEDANLRYANLEGANLEDANLRGANLEGANLRYANLRYANLEDANLRYANLRYANLEDANLEDIPIVPNLHTSILAAIEHGGKLDMNDWHTCETTHCRAGWAITLAGAEGKALEAKIGPAAAGALISVASCPALEGKVPDFSSTDEYALADIKRLAALEATA